MEVTIVDEHDNEIGIKNIHEVHWEHDIYRASALLLYNNYKQILLAQRAFTKEQSPGCWSASAAGIVEAGESYLGNILKETEEEIGLAITEHELTLGPKILTHHEDMRRQHFTQWFFALCEKGIDEFTLQESEVEALQWITQEEFERASSQDPKKYIDVTPKLITHIPGMVSSI